MATNHNHAPTPATPYDNYVDGRSNTPEQMNRDRDPAADLVDVADEVQRSMYEIDPNLDREAIFEPGTGIPGGYETLLVASELRKEGRNTLLPSEEALVKHMKHTGENYSAQARVDFDAIAAAHPGMTSEEAQAAVVNEMIQEIETKRAAATDRTEVQKLTIEIDTLQQFLALQNNPPVAQDGKLFAKLLQADNRAQNATGAQKQDFETEVKDLSKQVRNQDKPMLLTTGAYKIIADKYGKQPDNNADDMPRDPNLGYVVPETPEEAKARTTAENEMKAAQAEMDKQELDYVRTQLADIKSSGILKRAIANRMNPEQVKGLEDRYRELCRNAANEKYGNVLNNPNASYESKAFVATKAVIEEQTLLRNLTNEKIKNTWVAKTARWVGRHKVLVMGGSILLVPLTGGASLAAGAAIGAGVLVGAKIDTKMRGMKSAEKSINQTEFVDMGVKKQASGGNVGYYAYHNEAMKKYRHDLFTEKWKRTGAVTGGGLLTALIGLNVLPATPGLDSAIHAQAAHQKFVYAGAGLALAARHKKLK